MKKNSYKFLLLFLTIFSFYLFTKSEINNNLFISFVSKIKENEYEIVFNNVLLIRGIKLHRVKISEKEVLDIELPKYVSSNGREYEQVRILSDDLYEKIKKAIIECQYKKQEINGSFPAFKINKFLPYSKSSKLKVNASVIFEDVLEIECKIIEDDYKNIYILWPSEKFKRTNKWIKKVEFLSTPYQKIIEKQLIDRYKVYKIEKGS